MRFLVLFVLALGLALASAQTVSDTNSNSWTPTPSWTNSPSNSVSGSNTWTASNTWTRSASWTNSNTNSWTATTTLSASGTPTGTYPQPDAPTGLVNTCLNHIQTACFQWSDPTNFVFNYYRLYIQNTVAGSVVNVFTATQNALQVTTLQPAQTYNVWVAGVDTGIGVWSANSTVITITTAAADPKKDPTRDIQNFQCSTFINSVTKRTNVECTWDPAADTVIHVNVKAHCINPAGVTPIREPLLVRKKLWGSKATATFVDFAINRDTADCNFYARFYYQRRPTTRHHFHLSY